MHARELVDLAALIAENFETCHEAQSPIATGAVERYWISSKSRFGRWHAALKQHTEMLERTEGNERRLAWRLATPLIEEILSGDVHSRVFAAVQSASPKHANHADAVLMIENVLAGQIEARNRALHLIVRGGAFNPRAAAAMNRLRRRVESWTDLLLGRVALSCVVDPFAFDARRASEYAADFAEDQRLGRGETAWRLLLASLRAAFLKDATDVAANPQLNRNIAAAVLGCFPADAFDSTGVFKSLWLIRLEVQTTDTQGMIDSLLLEDGPSSLPAIDESVDFAMLRRG